MPMRAAVDFVAVSAGKWTSVAKTMKKTRVRRSGVERCSGSLEILTKIRGFVRWAAVASDSSLSQKVAVEVVSSPLHLQRQSRSAFHECQRRW